MIDSIHSNKPGSGRMTRLLRSFQDYRSGGMESSRRSRGVHGLLRERKEGRRGRALLFLEFGELACCHSNAARRNHHRQAHVATPYTICLRIQRAISSSDPVSIESTMASRKGCNPILVVLLCCISFVLGYTLAMLKVPGSHTDFAMAMSNIMEIPGGFMMQAPSAESPDNNKRDPRVTQLEDYLAQLVDSTVGAEVIRTASLTAEELKLLFRGALIQALTIEKYGCDTSSTVRNKDQLPSVPPEEEKPPLPPPPPPPPPPEVVIETPRKRRIPKMRTLQHFSGIGKIDRKEFTEIIDTGSPIGLLKKPNPGVMILYGSAESLPTKLEFSESAVFADTTMVNIPAEEAVANCRQVSVILVKDTKEPVCWAFVPGQEAFHIQKWLRVPKGYRAKFDPKAPLRLVSRGYDPVSGLEHPRLPTETEAKTHRLWLGSYLTNVVRLLQSLRPLADRVAVNNQLIISVVNVGQSDVLLNFACAARNRGFNVSNMLVFVLDEESKTLVEGLGMTAFYDFQFLGRLPSKEPKVFGDAIFTGIVYAKLIATHLVSLLGYDFLYQDVDVVWYKDPLSFFNDPELADPDWDMYFQDDMNPAVRYQPLRGNTGFYYVRNNNRTRSALKDAILKTDQLETSRSQQQTLLEILSEHISYHGLRVKVFDGRDTAYFPTGGHFHLLKGFMKSFLAGELTDVFMFHMNWTKNKREKLDFMKQMGLWFVQKTCDMGTFMNKTLSAPNMSPQNASTNGLENSAIVNACCSREPVFSCHFRDKPSMKSCKHRPPYVPGAKSWW